jgi:imidazoleglycerol-phosphate dehydratase/histidinol-phosphatase
MLKAFENEGITFDDILIDASLPEHNTPTRKPRTGLLTKYMQGEYDLKNSFVIGDRKTDVELARNLGTRSVLFSPDASDHAQNEVTDNITSWVASSWDEICHIVALDIRISHIERKTGETDITVDLNIDGTGMFEIHTGLGFFDHMIC